MRRNIENILTEDLGRLKEVITGRKEAIKEVRSTEDTLNWEEEEEAGELEDLLITLQKHSRKYCWDLLNMERRLGKNGRSH